MDMKKLYALAFALLTCTLAQAQVVWSEPAFPTQTDEITIYFDASQGNGDLTGVIPVYAHTGVITNNSSSDTDWQHVQGNWGQVDASVLMTPMGNNIHKIIITPQTFYELNVGETVSKLAFVFRNQSGSLVGRNADGSDIYMDIYQAGFNAGITNPANESQIVDAGTDFTVNCQASSAADITISVNGTEVSNATGVTTLDYIFNETAGGEYLIEMEASNGSETITDSVTLIILPTVNVAAAPAGTLDGINYINSTTVRLQIYAPGKDYIFVVGDFNDWLLDLDYFMNRTPDGSTYWLEISGLDPDTEYRFQYHIDDEGMRVAEIYADKILNAWDDPWIPESTYPNLIDYPTGLTTEPVSVFQINQPEFDWTDAAFQRPPQNRLVVYELLIRDFIAAHDYQTLLDTLDYIDNLGITCIELMPINEFEGNVSWGYNPSFFFAPDKYYGTPEALKAFVNEAHNRGIAVIMDIALNHSFGQNPMVRMYFNPDAGDYGQPTADSPWFNETPKHDFNVGYDFNHESTRTRNFCKRVLAHWMDEYHIDGYRFDLSKGFTQNNTLGDIGAWSAYDQSRVNILNDYYQHMQSVAPGSYAILEHLGDNSEETVLANSGMMLWGKMTTEYEEASMGYGSNLSWGSYQARGWSQPRLVTYAESHDEERMMYKNLEFGNISGSYNITSLSTALERQELAHCLLIPIPGPKMIWQFGELGYDYSINYCEDGTINSDCRTAPKPIMWSYQDQQDRLHVYKVVAALNQLKKNEAIFSTTDFDLDVAGFGKRIHLNGSTQNAVVVGNTNVTGINMIPGFQHTGTWYDYFTHTSFEVTDLGASFSYTPGEYHIYTDYELAAPDLNTSIEEIMTFFNDDLIVFPNPSAGEMNINLRVNAPGMVKIELYDMAGRAVATIYEGNMANGVHQFELNQDIPEGQYVVRAVSNATAVSQPVIILNR
jgi:hypothetical protein